MPLHFLYPLRRRRPPINPESTPASTPARIPATCLLFALAFCSATAARAADAITADTLTTYSTMHSIGVEWSVQDDDNLDAHGRIEYRPSGSTQWLPGLDLFRISFNGSDTVAGSILFLTPGVDYELQVSLIDPDGGNTTAQRTVATRPLPVKPVGPEYHVVPGSGGGDGSVANPFGGLDAAAAVAVPGATVTLHQGSYPATTFDRAGSAGAHVVYQSAGDGEVNFGGITVAADYVWLDGLTVRDQPSGLATSGSPQHVVVQHCSFHNNHYSIDLRGGGGAWYIADNVIVGDTPYETASLGGEGIELWRTSGHTVAHNSITRTADGISYPQTNVDIFGNDIFDTSDDGIEADNGRANVRMWHNRLTNTRHNGITFQDQLGAPWYIIGNQVANWDQGGFKFRTTDQFVLISNTFVNWHQVVDHWSQNMLNAYSRNNLFVSISGNINKGDASIFGMRNPGHGYPDIRVNRRTNLDYDGFDWGAGTTPPFTYFGQTYSSVTALSADLGIESNGIRVDQGECLNGLQQFPGPNPALVALPLDVTLKAGCPAIDAGTVVPNITGSFAGAAPDLGALEHGQTLRSYGPRTSGVKVPNPPTNLRSP